MGQQHQYQFAEEITTLKTVFSQRMASFDAHEQDFKIFSSPFDIDADLVPEKYQIELKELQCTFHYYPVHNIL